MKRRTVLATAWCVLPLHAAEPAAALLAQVKQRLADAPVLRGQFEQRKTLKGFKNPLVSRGDYVVARDRGVLWHTREPFASTLLLTRGRLLSWPAGGQAPSAPAARDEPGVRALQETLSALMSADLDALSRRFHIEGALVGAAGWRLALVPRDAAAAQWVARIELEGERHVDQVRVFEAQGDVSVLRLGAQAVAPALSREEAERFGPP